MNGEEAKVVVGNAPEQLHYVGTIATYGGVYRDRWLNDIAFLSVFTSNSMPRKWHCSWDVPGVV